MRELVVAVEREPGADPVMDVFRESGDLRSVAFHASSEGFWRIDRVSGPSAAMAAIDRIYADHDRCLDCRTGVHGRRSTVDWPLKTSSRVPHHPHVPRRDHELLRESPSQLQARHGSERSDDGTAFTGGQANRIDVTSAAALWEDALNRHGRGV